MNLANIALLGVDVGYSLRRPTTGLAWSDREKFGSAKTHTNWDRRRQHIPVVAGFSVIAIDGPLAPLGSPDMLERNCERLFTRGAFQKRCKPGYSHIRGNGQDLRRAAAGTAQQLLHLAHPMADNRTIYPGLAIVEAFPNAFLGVLLDDQHYLTAKAPKRKKFDWLYDRAKAAGMFDQVMIAINWHNPDLLHAIAVERDHEKRAAYICLLTAACAASGKSEVVGDEQGGWFWLPPVELWAAWACDALAQNRAVLGVDAMIGCGRSCTPVRRRVLACCRFHRH